MTGEPTATGAAEPTATATGTARPTATGGVKPTAVTPVRTSDPGDGGNWFGALQKCPNGGQATEVQRLEFADLTGDGVKDALVARTCQASTSYWPSTVEVFDGTTGEKPKRIGTILKDVGSDDLPWFQSLSVSGKVVTVKTYGTSAKGQQSCPDLKLTYRYEYRSGAFTRIGRQATTVADCLVIR
ncbi:hypothetical protein [Actinoplanes sp. L3-i22]|uniref:hypothetical protein n=1 Tax=Actinoplanes sp. L3-i22 TaxID=2836373 RepID=UPI001C84F770|nr:hypothetical protein [Actinoplanes sp. L3-i22]